MGTRLKAAKAGDVGEIRRVQLRGRITDESAGVDLIDAVSVRTIVKRGRTAVVLSTTIFDDSQGIIDVSLGDNPSGWLPSQPAVGKWDVEYEVTFISGTVLTWPNGGYDEIEVFRDLD